MSEVRIVQATEDDVAVVLRLIKALAEYERLSDRVVATEESLRRNLFGARPMADVMIAFVGSEPVGFAVFFPTFSTFAGRPGLHLEDLYVEPAWRGRGVGRKLLAHVARIAVDRGCHAVSWLVLTWNEPAIRFYRSLGAEPDDDWASFRLSGDPLARLAR